MKNYYLTSENGKEVILTVCANDLRTAINMIAERTGASIRSNYLDDESLAVLTLSKNGKEGKLCLSCELPVYDLFIIEALYFGKTDEPASSTGE